MADIKDKNIHAGHRKRMLARYAETGFVGFSEHQIIEMLLFYAYPRKDQNDKAHLLLDRFGSLAALLSADENELRSAGVSTGYALMLFRLISELYTQRFDEIRRQGIYSINNFTVEHFINVLRTLFRSTLHAETDSCFELVMFLPDEVSPLYTEIFGRGARSAYDIDLRWVVSNALIRNAAAVAIARRSHEQMTVPDRADVSIARRLSLILDGIGISLADYMIVGEQMIYSVRDSYSGSFIR